MPILVGVLVILVLAGVVFLVPRGRRKLLSSATRVLSHAWEGVTSIAKQPTRLMAMLAAGATITLAYLFGLYASMRAFGGHLALPAVGAVYLAGSALAQAAPTPGGLGAVEAALIAGMVSVGLEKEVAVPAVLLFRLTTFWLPIVPGYAAFERLSRRKLI